MEPAFRCPQHVAAGLALPLGEPDLEAEAAQGFWNCPCVPMRERQECHCMLFLTEDNPFAGGDQRIDLEEIVRNTDPSQKSTS